MLLICIIWNFIEKDRLYYFLLIFFALQVYKNNVCFFSHFFKEYPYVNIRCVPFNIILNINIFDHIK